jgi:hypothetical protein
MMSDGRSAFALARFGVTDFANGVGLAKPKLYPS